MKGCPLKAVVVYAALAVLFSNSPTHADSASVSVAAAQASPMDNVPIQQMSQPADHSSLEFILGMVLLGIAGFGTFYTLATSLATGNSLTGRQVIQLIASGGAATGGVVLLFKSSSDAKKQRIPLQPGTLPQSPPLIQY
jgi:hypothetical protein